MTVGERGDIYRRLGVEPLINGRSTFTMLGGSLMPVEVLDAMREAAAAYVDMFELQDAVGHRIAELTHNEAAFVSGGAAAGLFLAAAACMVRDAPDGILRLDELDSLPRDFVVHRVHRVPEDGGVELAGGRFIEVGGASDTTEEEFNEALGAQTAAVIHQAGAQHPPGALPLEAVVRLANAKDIPVIVDAAAQLPPAENLWRFTAAGADLAIFSGGKGLCGPAGTGLVLGKAGLVDLVSRNSAPRQRVGRPMKVGKEEMIGLLTAVEVYLRQDAGEVDRRYGAMVDHLVAWGAGRSDVEVTREEMGEAGQPTPRARIRLTGTAAGGRDAVLAALRASPPRVDLLAGDDDSLYVAPETLVSGEEIVIADRLDEILG